MDNDLLYSLITPARTKIVMVIMDGLGGLPLQPGGKTELETARTPNLDALAEQSALGLTIPVGPGISAGSGPGHLSIFGYNPNIYQIGRGVMEALGTGFNLCPEDVAARGNFCTLDASGLITDRRAGRIPTAAARELAARLSEIHVPGVEIFVRHIKEHRFAVVLRGSGLGSSVSETDPLKTGMPPMPARPHSPGSEKTSAAANRFISEAHHLLADAAPANGILLRGFGSAPEIPSYAERFRLKAAAVAVHAMYRGVARLAGMDVLDPEGDSIEAEFATLEKHWGDYEFFYLHVKQTDTAGENGDFEGKAAAIEQVDAQISRVIRLEPDVIIVGGDHSSPAAMKAHSWHPVPLLIFGKYVRADGIPEFGERACARGSLGAIPAWHVMPLALANAGRVSKYGA